MLSLGICGCADDPKHMRYPPIDPEFEPPSMLRNGSIYQQGQQISLYRDRVAQRRGDILTVRLEETTQGEKISKSKNEKKDTITYPAPTFFGNLVSSLGFNTDTTQKFDGQGSTNQGNKLQGTISATVTDVYSNGNLVIQGESWITLNEGKEYIRLIGVVRPEDIGPNNTISSQRIAGAQITYSGNGQTADTSRGGLIMRLFNKFAPY